MHRIALHILIVGLLVVAFMPAAHATLLADHFGVTPDVTLVDNWNSDLGPYTAYQFDTSSLTPALNTGTADYQVNDWFGAWDGTMGLYDSYDPTGTYPAGEEPYDLEAYYFDDDADNLYFVTIVGFPSPADGIFMETRYNPDRAITQGDFAIDTPYLTGSQTDTGSSTFAYDYGVDLTDENRPASPTANVVSFASNTLGDDVYRTTTGWYLGTPNGDVNPVTGDQYNANTNFDPNSPSNPPGTMTNLGNATVSWYELDIPYGANPDVLENNAETYVIEITIPKSYLVNLAIGDQIQFRWLMGCRNDGSNSAAFLTGSGDIDFPEPGTLALLAVGAGPLGLWMRRRRTPKS